MRKYKTIKGLAKQSRQSLSAQEIVNGRFYHNKAGWIEFALMDNEHEAQIKAIAEVLGGRKQSEIYWSLKGRRPQHWGLGRIFYNPKSNRWAYCAGQDYPAELNMIRKYLYNI